MNPKLASGLSVKRWPIRATDVNVLLDGKKNAINLSVMKRWTGAASSVGAQTNAGMVVLAAMRTYMNTGVSI